MLYSTNSVHLLQKLKLKSSSSSIALHSFHKLQAIFVTSTPAIDACQSSLCFLLLDEHGSMQGWEGIESTICGSISNHVLCAWWNILVCTDTGSSILRTRRVFNTLCVEFSAVTPRIYTTFVGEFHGCQDGRLEDGGGGVRGSDDGGGASTRASGDVYFGRLFGGCGQQQLLLHVGGGEP